MKAILENRAPGFRMTLACIALSVVTLIVYTVIYSKTRFMSWETVGIIAAGVVLTLALIVLKQFRFAPALLMAADFLAVLFYIYHIYFYISSVATGIQFSGFPPEFFVNIVFLVATIALSVVCVFMPQTEE